jgi:hypothetical protein
MRVYVAAEYRTLVEIAIAAEVPPPSSQVVVYRGGAWLRILSSHACLRAHQGDGDGGRHPGRHHLVEGVVWKSPCICVFGPPGDGGRSGPLKPHRWGLGRGRFPGPLRFPTPWSFSHDMEGTSSWGKEPASPTTRSTSTARGENHRSPSTGLRLTHGAAFWEISPGGGAGGGPLHDITWRLRFQEPRGDHLKVYGKYDDKCGPRDVGAITGAESMPHQVGWC